MACKGYYNVAHALLRLISTNNRREGGFVMQNKDHSNQIFVDPVCAMEVRAGTADITSTYKSTIYYFCAEGCKKAFESNPAKFLSQKPGKKKGLWGRYLDRLDKATGGKSMKCH